MLLELYHNFATSLLILVTLILIKVIIFKVYQILLKHIIKRIHIKYTTIKIVVGNWVGQTKCNISNRMPTFTPVYGLYLMFLVFSTFIITIVSR